ncbi:MAG: methyltransferase domain-containing protein [Planctomycetaceae bacterium]|nr:methyltransferase domain-containing protein [Planctomycetaceae bacterium]
MLYEDIADSVAPAKDALYSSHAKRAHCQTNDHKSHRHLQGEPAKDSEGSQLLKTKDERRKFYDKIAPCYDLLAERSEQPIRETAFDMLSPAPGERILEIGCGTGHLLSRVAESVGEEGRVYGIDISQEMLRLTELVVEAKKLSSRVELVRGDAVSLPFDDDMMDAVILCFTLELFDSAEIPQVLAECKRVLRPDGRLVVAALSKEGRPPLVAKAFEWTHRHFPNFMDCRPIHLERSVEEAGFIIGADHLEHSWMPVEIILAHKPSGEDQPLRTAKTESMKLDRTDKSGSQQGASAMPTREQVHELRNRLYAASLAFRAICRMLDDGKSTAARTAAEAMLANLSDELHDSHECNVGRCVSNSDGDAQRVLLVEDDDMEAHLLSDYLTERGYEVTRAKDGIDALRQLNDGPLPDVVLLDMNMPRLDGPKTITSIRTSDRLKDLTLIAVSGTDATSADMQKARRNVNLWITKPADPERIAGAILELSQR